MYQEMLSGRRVLIVEDEMLVLMALEDMFSDLGCTLIKSAATVDQALTLIETKEFDLATLDLNLGGNRSDAVAVALTERHIPFCFSTGYGGDHDLGGGHAGLVLKKPFTVQQFTAIMQTLIGETLAPPTAALTP